MKYIKKHWFVIITILTIIRILMSNWLPIFYLQNMACDDMLMINQAESLLKGEYLGTYNDLTIVKGIIYPLFLTFIRMINLKYSSILSILYVLACVFFSVSVNKITKNKVFSILLYIALLFNPLSFSAEIFQRIYRNSLSIIELLVFFGFIIRIIGNEKNNLADNVLLGIITAILLNTREDNIWVFVILGILFICKIYKNIKIKNIIMNLIPIIVIASCTNIASFINYKYYGIYTYNELKKSNFKDTYIKILSIKDDDDKLLFPRNTLYKLSENTKTFDFTKEEIDIIYDDLENITIDKGVFFWHARGVFYKKYQFKTGKEAEEYFKKLGDEIDKLFKSGKLEKEIIVPSILINTPTIEELKKIPRSFLEAIVYTSTYENVKAFGAEEIDKLYGVRYNDEINAFRLNYSDYHHSDDIVEDNLLFAEIIRIIYKYFTLVFSIIALIIFIKNIKIKDKLNLIIIMILLTYLIILSGVVYSHVTAFHAIRYFYLVNIYILQSIFIMLNLTRLKINRHGEIEMEKNKKIGIFVPGRVSIIGELSDWVSDYKKYNDSIIPGEAIATGIDKGIYAVISASNDFIYEYNDKKIKINKMNEEELEKIAKSSNFFSYVCSVALHMKKNYGVKGINIKVMYMTLPIKKGLSSSACVSVLVAKAFNAIYNLNLEFNEIMEIAYKAERYALSKCGRLDQICAKGLSVSHIIFNENDLIVNPVQISKNMNFVICDVNGVKDTKNILSALHSCFPVPQTKEQEKVKRMLCEDNKVIITRSLKALEEGNLSEFGKIMIDAQTLIDESAGKICKDLEGPKLHQLMNDKFIKKMSYGSKGVGSNGDGAIEILAKDKTSQEKIINYLEEKYGLSAFKLDINKTYNIKKAVIPVAGFGTRVYPFTRTIKKSFLPIVEDDFVKPLILKLIEELDSVGIEKILLVIGKDEEEIYKDFFKKPLSLEHFNALSDKEKEYELKIMRIGEKISFKVQEEKCGYGHAVLESKSFANNEPVLMILGDTIYKSNTEESCIGQVLNFYDKYNKPVISLHELPEEKIKYFGIASGKLNDNMMEIMKIIEKPTIDVAKNLKVNDKYYGTFGISVIDNSIYEALNSPENKTHEFTKAIDIASKENNVIGFIVDGKQYDLGNANSYKKTTKEFK